MDEHVQFRAVCHVITEEENRASILGKREGKGSRGWERGGEEGEEEEREGKGN